MTLHLTFVIYQIFLSGVLLFILTYPYALPRLPYAPAALEPNLNRATIMTHHDRIFAGHIDGLNRALQPYPALQRRPLSRLLLHPDCLPAPARPDILHHGSGVYSHALYFSSGPDRKS